MAYMRVNLESGDANGVVENYWNETAEEMQTRYRLVSLAKVAHAHGYKNSQAVVEAVHGDTDTFPLQIDGMSQTDITVKAVYNPDVDDATNGYHKVTVSYAAPSRELTADEMVFATSTASGTAHIITGKEQKAKYDSDDVSDNTDHGADINVTNDSIEGTTIQVSAEQVTVSMVLNGDSDFEAADVESLVDTVNTNQFTLRHARTGRTKTVEAYAALMQRVDVPADTNVNGDILVNCSMLIKPNFPEASPVEHPDFTETGKEIIMYAHDVLWFRGRHYQSASNVPVKMRITSAYVVRVYDEVSWDDVFGTSS